MIRLNVNVDHVATLRNARGGTEPDPVTAALLAENAGASGIVTHLREDRRHIIDRDVRIMKDVLQTKLDLEMAATDEIIHIACDLKPALVTIVPEKRMERTTEGGLDLTLNLDFYKDLVKKMHDNDIEVSFFIEPLENQIEAALISEADMVELHTGNYSLLKDSSEIKNEITRIKFAGRFAKQSGLKVAAGHGMNYLNTTALCDGSIFDEFSIGHAIISRSIFVGIESAVKEMLDVIYKGEILHLNKDLKS